MLSVSGHWLREMGDGEDFAMKRSCVRLVCGVSIVKGGVSVFCAGQLR